MRTIISSFLLLLSTASCAKTPEKGILSTSQSLDGNCKSGLQETYSCPELTFTTKCSSDVIQNARVRMFFGNSDIDEGLVNKLNSLSNSLISKLSTYGAQSLSFSAQSTFSLTTNDDGSIESTVSGLLLDAKLGDIILIVLPGEYKTSLMVKEPDVVAYHTYYINDNGDTIPVIFSPNGTVPITHEVAESITDPNPSGFSDNGQEVADVCELVSSPDMAAIWDPLNCKCF